MAKLTEDETLISTLYEKIAKLESQNTEVTKRNKQLTDVLEKKKKQIASLERQVNEFKRREGPRKPQSKDRPKSAPEIDIIAAKTNRAETSMEHEQTENILNHHQLLDLVKTYKTRLNGEVPFIILIGWK